MERICVRSKAVPQVKDQVRDCRGRGALQLEDSRQDGQVRFRRETCDRIVQKAPYQLGIASAQGQHVLQEGDVEGVLRGEPGPRDSQQVNNDKRGALAQGLEEAGRRGFPRRVRPSAVQRSLAMACEGAQTLRGLAGRFDAPRDRFGCTDPVLPPCAKAVESAEGVQVSIDDGRTPGLRGGIPLVRTIGTAAVMSVPSAEPVP